MPQDQRNSLTYLIGIRSAKLQKKSVCPKGKERKRNIMDWRSGVIVVEKKFLETLYQVNIFVTCKVGAPIKSCGLKLGSGRENNQLLSRDQTATDGTSKQELRRLKSFLDPKYKGMHYKKHTW